MCLRRSATAYDHAVSMEDRSGRIDRDGPVSVWSQVAADIAADIGSGAAAPGARLPAEPELASVYGVSRITVRRAVRDLAARGLVTVSRGRGTYVTPEDQRP
jgi:DNA-binding GntR family transcriptional regulator